MKPTSNAITLNRHSFIKEMSNGNLTRFTLHKSGKQVHLVGSNDQGTHFILGTSAGTPRFWTDIGSPVCFLEISGIYQFSVEIDGESA